jgi:hypothetical protein
VAPRIPSLTARRLDDIAWHVEKVSQISADKRHQERVMTTLFDGRTATAACRSGGFEGSSELGSALHAKLLVGGMELVLHCPVGQTQPRCDLLVGQASCGEASDL